MGSVYLADQIRPVRRQVALKLIKAGMDSRAVLARFESERQALALMDHPNIARVLNAGTTEAGRPFFVMDLVKGVPLTEFCDARRLDLPARLAIFRQVCSAVQHAHQKGVIHRDLKPSNILVEVHDGRPVPKVIDFGLAKATNGLSLGDLSVLSAFGSVAGTPLYMAPEQASLGALDVDTRADIYALGVILYELLTGSTPIRQDTLRRAALDEMFRVIREVEPPTPSSRISSSDALPSLAATRQIEPSRLSRFLKGDLDWIVMKALAKERDRRYDSATALAQDVERFVNHEPVSAGPPTASYRLRKFVRRHRARVVAASLVLLALVAGIAGTTLGLIEARRQGLIAVAASEARRKALEAESRQRERAERRLAQVEKADAILGSIFERLDPRNEEKGGKPLAALLGERLDLATTQLEGEAIGDPLAIARLQKTLGHSQFGLGYPEKAAGLFAKARDTMAARLGLEHPETLACASGLAMSLRDVGDLGRAVALEEETLAKKKARLGPDHPDTLASMNNLAECYGAAGRPDRAAAILAEALALARVRPGPDHPDTLVIMENLAASRQAAGDPAGALPLFEEATARFRERLGPDHPRTLLCMNDQAACYLAAGKLDLALPLFERALARTRARLGPDHPVALVCMNNLAAGYRSAGDFDRALPLLEEALAMTRARRGPDHVDTLRCLNNLAEYHQAAGQAARALPLYEQALPLAKARLGPDHPTTIVMRNNLAAAYLASGQPGRAAAMLAETIGLQKAKLGPDHADVLAGLGVLAEYQMEAGRTDRAAAALREAVGILRSRGEAGSPQYGAMMGMLGLALIHAREWAEAEPIFREVLAIREAKDPDAWSTFNARSMLGGALLGQKKYAEADPLLRAGYAGLKERIDKVPSQARGRLVEAVDRLIELAEATGKADEASAWRDEKTKLPAPEAPAAPAGKG